MNFDTLDAADAAHFIDAATYPVAFAELTARLENGELVCCDECGQLLPASHFQCRVCEEDKRVRTLLTLGLLAELRETDMKPTRIPVLRIVRPLVEQAA